MTLALTMFCVGAFSALAQVLLTRELMFLFSGNELVIGLMLGLWLCGVAAGALAGRYAAGRRPSAAARNAAACAAAWVALWLPAAMLAARHVRSVLRVPFGEDIPPEAMLWTAAFLALPLCVPAGMVFPCLCSASADKGSRGITKLYAAEAVGSLAGGMLFSFILAGRLPVLACAALAGCFALAAAAMATGRRRTRLMAGGAAALFAFAASAPETLQPLAARSLDARWATLASGGGKPEMVAETDSIYQNLALFKTAGQYSAYGNGKVMFSFPDPFSAEYNAHLAMAQASEAKRVLLLGGNPADDIRELLKFPIEKLVFTEPDPEIMRLCSITAGPAACGDPRFEYVAADGARFLKTTREKFDLIIARVPPPATAALNRFYTREFFKDARNALNETGVFHTAAPGAENLLGEAILLPASVYKALKEVFPIVLVSAGEENKFFAGSERCGATLDRQTLFERARKFRVKTEFFAPEFFLGSDELDEEKTARAAATFEKSSAEANSISMPAAYFYRLLVWAKISKAGAAMLFALAQRVAPRAAAALPAALGIIALALAAAFGRTAGKIAERLAAVSAAAVLFATGFWGMSMEMLLIIIIQSFFGHIYARIGLLIGGFMLGSAAGALLAGRLQPRTWNAGIAAVFALECAMALLALALGFGAAQAAGRETTEFALRLLEIVLFISIAPVGAAVGAQFALAAGLLLQMGMRPSTAAGVAAAADMLGAGVGSILASAVLLPVMGITGAALVIAGVTIFGAMASASIYLACRRIA